MLGATDATCSIDEGSVRGAVDALRRVDDCPAFDEKVVQQFCTSREGPSKARA